MEQLDTIGFEELRISQYSLSPKHIVSPIYQEPFSTRFDLIEQALCLFESLTPEQIKNTKSLGCHIPPSLIQDRIQDHIQNPMERPKLYTIRHRTIFFSFVLCLSMHTNFVFSWVVRFPSWPWNWPLCSMNVSRLREVQDNSVWFPWVFGCDGMSANRNLTIDWVDSFPYSLWYFPEPGLSCCPNFCMSWYIRYPRKPWSFGANGISFYSRHLQPRDVRDNPNLGWCFDIHGLVGNVSFNLSWISELPDKPWDWWSIQTHSGLQASWVQLIPPEHINPHLIATNANFNPSWRHLLLPEGRYWPTHQSLIMHPNWMPKWFEGNNELPVVASTVFVSQVSKHFDISWLQKYPSWCGRPDFSMLSTHCNFDIKWYESNLQKPWNFGANGISSVPRLRLSWILSYPHAGWCCSAIETHKNFCFSWIAPLQRHGLPILTSSAAIERILLGNKSHLEDRVHCRQRKFSVKLIIAHLMYYSQELVHCVLQFI